MLRKFSSFFMGDSCPSFSKTVPSSTRHTSAMADDEQGAAAALPGQIVRTCHAANCLRPSVDDSLRSLFCRPCDADRLDYCNRYHCLPELWASWAESHVNFPESARQHLRTFIAVKQILFFPKMLEYRRYSSQRFFGGPDHGHLQYELHMQEVIDRHPTETSEVSELEQLTGGGRLYTAMLYPFYSFVVSNGLTNRELGKFDTLAVTLNPRFHATHKKHCLPPKEPLDLEDAQFLMAKHKIPTSTHQQRWWSSSVRSRWTLRCLCPPIRSIHHPPREGGGLVKNSSRVRAGVRCSKRPKI